MVRIIAACAALVVSTLGSSLLLATQEEERRPPFRLGFLRHGPPPFMGDAVIDELDLTEAQEDQIRAFREAARDEHRDAHRAVREARRALIEATLRADDESLLRQLGGTLGEAEGEVAVLSARLHSRVQEILTPEQRQKLTELRAKRESRLQERAERMRARKDRRKSGPRENP